VALFFLVAIVLALLVPVAHRYLGQPVAYPQWHPLGFLGWLAVYTVTTLSYSFVLKKKVLVDVIVLSGLYTVRILAGSSATQVPVSEWLGAFSIFFFLSLAFVKRFSELHLMQASNRTKASGRGYHTSDIEQLRSLGTGSAFASVVVLTMYISNLGAANLYDHVDRLWLLAPILILWISRVWLLASRGELHEDPVVYAITDKTSWALGALSALVVWMAL
jgi:4-hydroxybenzoate polyprenyltransferase